MDGPLGALIGGIAGQAADTLRQFTSEPADGTRQIAFTIGVIALGAKMAKADGQVTRDEIEAFKQVFKISPDDMQDVSRVFNLARRDVAGFEVSDRAARAGRAVGLDIRSGRELSEASFDPASIDLATMFCVLPHLHDPVAALRDVASVMRPGGILFMTLPNMRSLNFMAFRESWYHLDAPRHLFFFSKENLDAMAGRTGFAPLGRRFRSGGGGFKNSLRAAAARSGAAHFLTEMTGSRPMRWLMRTFYRYVVDPVRLGDTVDCWWRRI